MSAIATPIHASMPGNQAVQRVRVPLIDQDLLDKARHNGVQFLKLLLQWVKALAHALLIKFPSLFLSGSRAASKDQDTKNPSPPGATSPASQIDASQFGNADAGAADLAQFAAAGGAANALHFAADGNEEQLATKLLDAPGTGLEIELSGMPEDLRAIIGPLLKHMESLLAGGRIFAAPPTDETAALQAIQSLGEEAERLRYAHRLSGRQLALISHNIANSSEQYIGLSAAGVTDHVNQLRATTEGRTFIGEGSGEAQLAMLLDMEQKFQEGLDRHLARAATMLKIFSDKPDVVARLQEGFLAAANNTEGALVGRENKGLLDEQERGDAPFTLMNHRPVTLASKLIEAMEFLEQPIAPDAPFLPPTPFVANAAASAPVDSLLAAGAVSHKPVSGFGSSTQASALSSHPSADDSDVMDDEEEPGLIG